MVLLEALASATPVVGSAAGGIPEVITDSVGRVVPVEAPRRLASALGEVLSQPPEAYEQMSRAARERAETEYAWSVIADRVAALYEEVV